MIKLFVISLFPFLFQAHASTVEELREMFKAAPIPVNEFDVRFTGTISALEKDALIQRCGDLNKMNQLTQKHLTQTDPLLKQYKISIKKEYLDAKAVIKHGRTTTKPGHNIFHITIGNLH